MNICRLSRYLYGEEITSSGRMCYIQSYHDGFVLKIELWSVSTCMSTKKIILIGMCFY
jgi:hypothetical protein